MFELVPLGNKNVGKNSNGHRIGDGLDNTFCFDDNYKGDVRSLRRLNVDKTRQGIIPFPGIFLNLRLLISTILLIRETMNG